jgi:hypothetical protein
MEKLERRGALFVPIGMPRYDLLNKVPFELDKYMLSIRNSNILMTSFYV